ncbi:uncharacterized protein FTOL_12935 [Fusarium torulosum]|uniref:Uncharacterized protein n=1 Tax=Fusarium torulosum TaxID=33205 RepID=A0AAE8MMT9_9HYPO|nr:uncharacterized protein FTOL_12935 [Fusarium torulosum]
MSVFRYCLMSRILASGLYTGKEKDETAGLES